MIFSLQIIVYSMQPLRGRKAWIDSAACANLGLIINAKKTQVLHQPALHHEYLEPQVTADGEVLNAVDKLTYFGSVLSKDVHIDDEVDTCIARASSKTTSKAFQAICVKEWRC